MQYLLDRKDPEHPQKTFRCYPKYLQHTVLYNDDELLNKTRKKDIGNRYYVNE